jgi:hypothetical protein
MLFFSLSLSSQSRIFHYSGCEVALSFCVTRSYGGYAVSVLPDLEEAIENSDWLKAKRSIERLTFTINEVRLSVFYLVPSSLLNAGRLPRF